MPVSTASTSAPGVTSRLRRVVWELRTEGAGPAREAAAIGLGVFIGCSPLYGFHLLLCLAVGWCLGLNRLKMYLAANISNPFVAPFLLLAGAPDRRVDQAGSAARAHPRRRQEHRSLELRRGSHRRQPRRRRRAWDPERRGHLLSCPVRATTIRVRCARAPRRRSLRIHEHHRVGVRARQAAGRSALPHRPDRMRAAFGRDARRRRLRSGAHAGAARRVRSGVARGHLAVILAAAASVRPAPASNTAVASRRSPAGRSTMPRRLSKATLART